MMGTEPVSKQNVVFEKLKTVDMSKIVVIFTIDHRFLFSDVRNLGVHNFAVPLN
jgi:hypothetical protein